MKQFAVDWRRAATELVIIVVGVLVVEVVRARRLVRTVEEGQVALRV